MALSRCAPSGPRSLTPGVIPTRVPTWLSVQCERLRPDRLDDGSRRAAFQFDRWQACRRRRARAWHVFREPWFAAKADRQWKSLRSQPGRSPQRCLVGCAQGSGRHTASPRWDPARQGTPYSPEGPESTTFSGNGCGPGRSSRIQPGRSRQRCLVGCAQGSGRDAASPRWARGVQVLSYSWEGPGLTTYPGNGVAPGKVPGSQLDDPRRAALLVAAEAAAVTPSVPSRTVA